MRNTLLSKKIRNTLKKNNKKKIICSTFKQKKKKKAQKICKRASLPRKKSPTPILNNRLQTQSKEKKNKEHGSKPIDSQNFKKNKKPKLNVYYNLI